MAQIGGIIIPSLSFLLRQVRRRADGSKVDGAAKFLGEGLELPRRSPEFALRAAEFFAIEGDQDAVPILLALVVVASSFGKRTGAGLPILAPTGGGGNVVAAALVVPKRTPRPNLPGGVHVKGSVPESSVPFGRGPPGCGL
jgi:hypothetical protein